MPAKTQSKNKEIIVAARRLHKGIERFKGELENTLLPARAAEVVKITKMKEKIITEVTDEYKVPLKILLKSRNREAIKAKTMIIILFDKYLFITNKQIAGIFNTTTSLISYRLRAFRAYKNNNENTKQITENKLFYGNDFMNKFQKIDASVSQYAKVLWGNPPN